MPFYVDREFPKILFELIFRIESLFLLELFFSTFMAWLPMEFIIYTGQDLRFRMLGSFFFLSVPNLGSHLFGFYNPLPALGQDKFYISETLFTFIFGSFVLWTFHLFVFQSKRIYTVLIWCRILAYLVCLRIVTIYSTQLPGPNYHCREGSKFARLPPPESVLEVFLVNFPQGVIYGCGDLIFSSHMIFTLVFVRTYKKYGMRRYIKQFAWLLAVIQTLLIIASRKHYTVDIVVAWYTVNLVAFFLDRKLPELPDRSSGSTAPPLLPLSTRNKDGKNKEEHQILLNGNSLATTSSL
ncbi:hypothetical protein REPUB_Repub05bG0169300 [Reevesia pubescens]